LSDEEEQVIEVQQVECKHCHYKWVPRVENPKACPRCKRPTEAFSSAKNRQVVGIRIIEQDPMKSIVWCVNHRDASTTGEKLAMFEFLGKTYCLECMIALLDTYTQLDYQELLQKARAPTITT